MFTEQRNPSPFRKPIFYLGAHVNTENNEVSYFSGHQCRLVRLYPSMQRNRPPQLSPPTTISGLLQHRLALIFSPRRRSSVLSIPSRFGEKRRELYNQWQQLGRQCKYSKDSFWRRNLSQLMRPAVTFSKTKIG